MNAEIRASAKMVKCIRLSVVLYVSPAKTAAKKIKRRARAMPASVTLDLSFVLRPLSPRLPVVFLTVNVAA